MKNIQKNEQTLLLFGGKFKTWGGGEISPPKGPEKKITAVHKTYHLIIAVTFSMIKCNFPPDQ